MKKLGLFLPWLLVLIATVGSLYSSEVTHLKPCTLCWYQRIMIFPLAIILGIAAFRGAYRIILYVLPLTLIGLGIAAYQVIMIQFFAASNQCAECTLKSVSDYPIAFPLFSLLGFLVLNIVLIWLYLKHKKSKKL